MVLGIITLLITILCIAGLVQSFQRKNFFAVGYAALAIAVFGWFSVMTIKSSLFPTNEEAISYFLMHIL